MRKKIDEQLDENLDIDNNLDELIDDVILDDLDENSDEVIIYKWFVSKLLTVSDLKASEKNLRVSLKIAESMMKKASIKSYVIDIYIKYMAIVGTNLIHNAEQRFESIREFQVNQLPF